MKIVQRRAVSLVMATVVATSCIFSTAMVKTSAQDTTDDANYIYVPTNLYKYNRAVINGAAPAGLTINQKTLAAAAAQGGSTKALYFDKPTTSQISYSGEWNYYHSPGSSNVIYPNLVKNTLDANGNLQWASGYTVADLFAADKSADASSYRTDYTDLSFPLEKEMDTSGNFTGYYSFSSDSQRAVLDQANKTFTLEDQDIAASDPRFSPFYSGAAGSIDNSSASTYSFGMNMNMSFTVPTSGTVDGTTGGDPITYSFSGDDDVWIFVDGTLVLDLGGIHQAVNGTLDFSTLKWQTKDISYSSNPNKIIGSGTFSFNRSLTQHTITVYYLERGAGMSNFSMRCNLPQSSSFEVGKQLTGDRAKGDTGTYTFQAYYDSGADSETLLSSQEKETTVQDSGAELKASATLSSGDGDLPLANTSYNIFNLNGGTYVSSGTTNDTGQFTLKAGQKAVFSYSNSAIREKLGGSQMRVEEIGDNADKYNTTWQTTVGSTVETGSGKEAEVAAPADDNSIQTSSIVFTNKLPVGISTPTKTAAQTSAQNRTYDVTLKTSTLNPQTEPTFTEIPASEGVTGTTYYEDESTNDPIHLTSATTQNNVWEYVSDGSTVSPTPTASTLFTKSGTATTEYDEVWANALDTSATYYVKPKGNSTYTAVTYLYDVIWMDQNYNMYSPKTSSTDKRHDQFYQANAVYTYTAVTSFPTAPDGKTYYVKNGSSYEAVQLIEVSSGATTWVDASNNPLDPQPDNVYEMDPGDTVDPITATVRDTIDSRFVVVDENGTPLTDGATVQTNDDGTDATLYVPTDAPEYLVWNDQEIPVDPSYWEQTVRIMAKPEFIGGNDIPTNVKSSSYVSYSTDDGTAVTKEFTQPTVNVPVKFQVENTSTNIFLRESVPAATLQPYTLKADGTTKVTGDDIFCGQGSTGTFSYQWLSGAASLSGATSNTFPTGQTPSDTTTYTLSAKFTPGSSGTVSQATGGGTPAAAVTQSGTYAVNVVKGELDLTKIIDRQYPAPSIVNAQQSFVFQITRSDTQAGLATSAETFYEVITPGTETSGTTKRITGLKKGYYKVTEETGGTSGAWRYQQNGSTQDNDGGISVSGYTGSSSDGIVYIGCNTSATTPPSAYFGAETGNGIVPSNPATVTISNKLQNFHWFGDTTYAVNTVSNAE